MPSDFIGWLTLIGALLFGVVIGWIVYRTLVHAESTAVSDIATVIGAVGGAGVTGLFDTASGAFGAYCIGLTGGFFIYFFVAKANGVSVLDLQRRSVLLQQLQRDQGEVK